MIKSAADIQQDMVEHIGRMVTYWVDLPGLTVRDRCDGVAFSILTMLDGAAVLPRFLLITHAPFDSDYPDGVLINGDVDLHDAYTEFCNKRRPL